MLTPGARPGFLHGRRWARPFPATSMSAPPATATSFCGTTRSPGTGSRSTSRPTWRAGLWRPVAMSRAAALPSTAMWPPRMRCWGNAVFAVDLLADVLVRQDAVIYRVCDLDEFQQARRNGLILPVRRTAPRGDWPSSPASSNAATSWRFWPGRAPSARSIRRPRPLRAAFPCRRCRCWIGKAEPPGFAVTNRQSPDATHRARHGASAITPGISMPAGPKRDTSPGAQVPNVVPTHITEMAHAR
jgi:hypothetical protein